MLRAVVESERHHAFAYKENNQWRYLATDRFRDQVADLALALRKIGLQKGDTVAIISQPSPQWLMMDLAVMVAGGVTVPIFAHIASDIFEYQLEDAKIAWCFVAGDEQWELVTESKNKWKGIINHNLHKEGDDIYTLSMMLKVGAQERADHPTLYHDLREAVKPEDLATIIYTSGSTGMPKGVCLSQWNIVSQLHAAAERFPLDTDADKALSCLPLAHVFERMVMYFYISRGISITFADDIQNVGVLLREVQPTTVTMVPRLLEKVYASILKKAQEANFFKRQIAQWAFSEAHENDPISARDTWSFQIADNLVYGKLREALGGNLKYIIVGGARLSPDLQRFFLNIGLPLFVGYGLSEASPVIAANYPGHNRIDTVGPVFPDIEVKLGEGDEILARGPNIMQGYLNLPDKTADVIDEDGWLHTGDCGKFEDGFLSITGRIKELFKTSNGKYVAPVPIEQKICESPVIDMAMLIAEGRKFVSCLFFPDQETLEQLKLDTDSTHLKNVEFFESEFMRDRMEKLLETVNNELNHWEQVRKYKFIDEVPSIEGGELTPTMKIRRHIIEEKYANVIEDLYKEADA